MSAAGSRGGGGRKGSDSDWSSKSGEPTSHLLDSYVVKREGGGERDTLRERQREKGRDTVRNVSLQQKGATLRLSCYRRCRVVEMLA
jgi:hypothetical protein